MKKNDMLNESTIRRFMKLATIDGLSDKFVDEKLQESEDVEEGMRGKLDKRDDEEMREGEEDLEEMRAKKRDDDEMRESEEDLEEMRAKKRDDDEMREGAHEDDEEMRESDEELTFEEEDLEERGMDMPMDRDDDLDAAPAKGGMVSVDDLMSALEKALEDVLGQEVEVSQDDEMEMDADMDMGAADEEPAMDLDADKEDDDDDLGLDEATPKTDVVEEVYARVIQRLTKETKSNKK